MSTLASSATPYLTMCRGVQIGKELGYRIIAVDSESKREICMRSGATAFIDFKDNVRPVLFTICKTMLTMLGGIPHHLPNRQYRRPCRHCGRRSRKGL